MHRIESPLMVNEQSHIVRSAQANHFVRRFDAIGNRLLAEYPAYSGRNGSTYDFQVRAARRANGNQIEMFALQHGGVVRVKRGYAEFSAVPFSLFVFSVAQRGEFDACCAEIRARVSANVLAARIIIKSASNSAAPDNACSELHFVAAMARGWR